MLRDPFWKIPLQFKVPVTVAENLSNESIVWTGVGAASFVRTGGWIAKLMFVGWEGVGIMSYLLINFWYFSINSNKSAIKAILYNGASYFKFNQYNRSHKGKSSTIAHESRRA